MSHSKEREEKICLNCKAELTGRFCHLCGQENLEPKESVWGLISHFFYDITHFDGKFFNTLRFLVWKPGFLSKEYIRGRRASYLNPIRMYVFTSALFFIIFYAMFRVDEWNINITENAKYVDSVKIKLANAKESSLRSAKNKEDSARIIEDFNLVERIPITKPLDLDSSGDPQPLLNFAFEKKQYRSRQQYDSIQKILPVNERDGWLRRKVVLRSLELNKKYKQDYDRFFRDLAAKFVHTFPYLLFVSLPLYALFLKILYLRRKRFYVDHGIFLIHLYIFTFIVLLLLFALIKLEQVTNWGWIGFLIAALIIYGLFYTLKAMRNFYGQGWGKTIFKFTVLNFLAFISLILLFILFFVLTVFRI
ncbi:MAG: DUF3667 domain-containing protein [Kaistella sp.]